MAFEFRLPDVGEGIAEAEIVRWLVTEGEHVALDQPLLEIQTDKAIVEVPAPAEGVIGQFGGGAGDILHVGDLLVRIEPLPTESQASDGHEAAGAGLPGADAAEPSAAQSRTAASMRPLATPVVRKLARELAIDLASVAGSGAGGRITADDLNAYSAGLTHAGAPLPETPPDAARQATGAAVHAPSGVVVSESQVLSPDPSFREPLQGLRRRIAEAMAESWRTIPHITGHDEVEVDALVRLRGQLQPAAEAAGVHLTYLPFIIKAAVAALKRYPMANAFLDQAAGEIVHRGRINIGIATATPDGLIVPVVHDADQKSLREIQAEIAGLSEQARSRRIGLSALQGGTFTITNFGSLGGWLGSPIIRPGEAAILGAGRIEERPWVVEGRIEARPVMTLSLSADHRLIDGDVSTGFLRTVAGYLSDPLSLFLELT